MLLFLAAERAAQVRSTTARPTPIPHNGMEDLTKLSRKQLQAEAKQHGVKANLASDEIIRQLQALLWEKELREEKRDVAEIEGAGHRGSVEGSAVHKTQYQESSVAHEARRTHRRRHPLRTPAARLRCRQTPCS
jgi:hypothetical protein